MGNKCNLCKESELGLGDKTDYGAIIIFKSGGWFATISPKTGGDPKKDFTVQLMPTAHLKHMSEISDNLELAKNYGIAFAKLSKAITEFMMSEGRGSENEENAIRVGIYGKSKHPNEHLHIKIFPWTNNIGQPYTLDSTFEKSEIFNEGGGGKFIKMKPVKKVEIDQGRLNFVSKRLISLLE